jgi:hypothetical protein
LEVLDVVGLNDVDGSQGRESEFGGVMRFWVGFGAGGGGEKLEVGKDTDILRLLDKRSKHRASHSELLSLAEGSRNSQNYGSKTDGRELDFTYVHLTARPVL